VHFAELAIASSRLAETRSRLAKTAIIAEVLRRLAPAEAPIVVPILAGQLRQRRTGIGYVGAGQRPPAAATATLDVMAVDAVFEAAGSERGPGAAGRRAQAWTDLLAAATTVEQDLLIGLVTGDVRQGAAAGVLTEALAAATGVPAPELRRAVTMAGSLTDVAVAVLADGPPALANFAARPGRPLAPMLAASAPSVAQALERTGPAHVDWKLDGIRVQAHVLPAGTGSATREVRLFTRSLEEITDRAPAVVATLREGAQPCILDGELLVLAGDARPAPFQQTASRVAKKAATGPDPLTYVVFDLLGVGERDLLDEPLQQRRAELDRLVVTDLLAAAAVGPLAGAVVTAPQLRCDDGLANSDAAAGFAGTALARGHEGVVVKAAGSAYASGRRGSSWIKVKPRETLDLVVLAVEWGSGRRRGWLSNLHLGALDADGSYGDPGGFVTLGKTFKGLTDAMLAWQTERLLDLAVDRGQWRVDVRPELIVEVAFDGVQTSPRYPAGLALRFARVLRHRPDKSATQADTVAAVRAIHQGGTDITVH